MQNTKLMMSVSVLWLCSGNNNHYLFEGVLVYYVVHCGAGFDNRMKSC